MPPNCSALVHYGDPIKYRKYKEPIPDLSGLTLAELRDRIMTEPDGPRLTNLLTEVAQRLDLNVSLEDFHVAQQLFHVSGLNTRRETVRRWTSKDAEKMYWQRRRLQKALIRITKENWRPLHRCDEFCVDDCNVVCPDYESVCYKCDIMYPVYIAKYPQRSYFHNLVTLIKKSWNGEPISR